MLLKLTNNCVQKRLCIVLDDDGADYDIPYDDHCIKWIQGAINDPECSGTYVTNGCLTTNEFSFGYFKIPISGHYARLSNELDKEFILYLNPTSNYFTITSVGSDPTEQFKVEVLNLSGISCSQSLVSNGGVIDVTNLPAGCYMVKITTANNSNYFKQFVKI